MRFDILSLFPGYFRGPFDESMLKRAKEKGLIDIALTDIRDFSTDRHSRVDDRPYGGGPGMVMMAEPVVAAIRSARREDSYVIHLSPQGGPLTAKRARELSESPHLVLLCGHYEGIDQRALDSDVDEEISIGDYVLTNGCLAAIVLVDAISRFVPGVLGDEDAADEDSFEGEGWLDCPQYTRPPIFEGVPVPDVLLQGHHEKIRAWRHTESVRKTKKIRPDIVLAGR